jgi:hypothetical protein
MLLLLLPCTGFAEGLAAYMLDETEWNGLSSLVVLAEFGGYTIESFEAVDLDGLQPGADVLLVVYPTDGRSSAVVAHWVARGGSVLIADDFGSGDALMTPFEIRLGPYQGATEVLEDNPQLPLLGPVGSHAISEGVHRIALNHPSTLLGEGVPVFAFDDGTGAVYDMSLGRGRAVLLSDPSLLTNLMLPVAGNQRFVLNLLAVLCPDQECRLVLATGETELSGSRGSARDLNEPDVASLLERLVDRLRNMQVAPRVLHFAAFLLALGSVQLLLTLFPRKRPAWLDARIRPRRVRPLNEFEFNLSRYGGSRRETNLAVPASLLKERFEKRFYAAIRVEPPGLEAKTPDFIRVIDAYARRFEPGLGTRERRALVKSIAVLHSIPSRAAFLVVRSPWVDEKTLLQLIAHVAHLIDKAGLNDEFESDVRRPDANS